MKNKNGQDYKNIWKKMTKKTVVKKYEAEKYQIFREF